jgi:hypothetical protein
MSFAVLCSDSITHVSSGTGRRHELLTSTAALDGVGALRVSLVLDTSACSGLSKHAPNSDQFILLLSWWPDLFFNSLPGV